MTIDLAFRPSNDAELALCLADPHWRVCSGALYQIMLKSDKGDGSVVPFMPNRSQRKFMKRMWHRNIILKARQLGFTTLIAIMWLDHALFNADQRCGIIAQDKDAAQSIFLDKVKLAYERLPEQLRLAMPLKRDSATQLLFGHNNSSIRVATSMRSGTIHRLHVSEFGKIGAKYPEKAKEVMTGSLPAVPLDGIAIIESTAEGREGAFFKMSQMAEALAEKNAKLTERDYRFHFFPWHEEPAYRIDADVVLTAKDVEYFASIEASEKTKISPQQRAWYVATRDSDFGGDPEKMWQEYPSTSKEAFQVSTEGTYYAIQLTAARKAGRIGLVPVADGVPVNTFWDIGNSDGTAIWFHQQVGLAHRFVKFIEGWGEPYSYYTKQMQDLGYVWGTHYLPHDAAHKRQQGDTIASPKEMLEKLNIAGEWKIVPVVSEVTHGIQLVRSIFGECWFDEAGCKEGIDHLAAYRKTWNATTSTWSSTPRHDVHSEASDAFRQFAQSAEKLSRVKKPVKAEPIPIQSSWRKR